MGLCKFTHPPPKISSRNLGRLGIIYKGKDSKRYFISGTEFEKKHAIFELYAIKQPTDS